MTDNPLLSIIVPVYNVEQWLPACINSILAQTYENWELILINDGSSDNSGEICDEFAAKDSRIKVFHQKNAGVSAARNKGLDNAKGYYLTFIDADDELGLDNTLEDNIKLLDSYTFVDIVQYPIGSAKYDNTTIISHPDRKVITGQAEIITAICTVEITGYLCGKIFRTNLFNNIRLPENIHFAEDTCCLIDLSDRIKCILLSKSGYYQYNFRNDSAVRTFNADKCLDLFQMSYKLFIKLYEIDGVSAIIRNKYFFTTFHRLLDARIAKRNAVNLTSELMVLSKFVPTLKTLFYPVETKWKIWLILIKVLSIRRFADCYTKFVLRRTNY